MSCAATMSQKKKTCLDLFFFLAGLSHAVSLYFCHDKTFRTVTLSQIAAQTCNFFLWLVSHMVASAPNGLLAMDHGNGRIRQSRRSRGLEGWGKDLSSSFTHR